MTAELTVLALAALLQAVQIVLAGAAMTRDAGPGWNVGPRDATPAFSERTERLRRAVANHFEALAFFTIAVVVVTLSGKASPVTATCAWVYVAMRVLYIPAYAFGWTPWRSVIFGIGFTATLVMILAALV